jgi:hypothetical protein
MPLALAPFNLRGAGGDALPFTAVKADTTASPDFSLSMYPTLFIIGACTIDDMVGLAVGGMKLPRAECWKIEAICWQWAISDVSVMDGVMQVEKRSPLILTVFLRFGGDPVVAHDAICFSVRQAGRRLSRLKAGGEGWRRSLEMGLQRWSGHVPRKALKLPTSFLWF